MPRLRGNVAVWNDSNGRRGDSCAPPRHTGLGRPQGSLLRWTQGGRKDGSFRSGRSRCVVTASAASAQTPVERGKYLVEDILTCGNCHSPRGPGGVIDAARLYSGGPQEWDTPALQGEGLEHHAGHRHRHRQAGAPPTSRRRSARASGRTACSSRRSCRTASTRCSRRAISTRSWPICKSVPRGEATRPSRRSTRRRCTSSPAGRREADERSRHGRSGEAGLLPRHHRPLHGVPYADGVAGRDLRRSLGKGGFEFTGPWGVSVSRNITSHKEKGIGDWSDAEIKRAITQGVRKDGTQAQAADGLRVVRAHDRRGSLGRRRVSAHGAAEGVTAVMPALVAGERPQPRGIHVLSTGRKERRGWPGQPSPPLRLARP